MSKYAIVFLCMLKEHYVVGACITAYIHKCFIKQLSMNIKLIIMCDDNIYDKYNHLLKLYFDSVVRLKLEYFPISHKYNFAKEKYISWVSYATNKWQCLKYDAFDKILFLDIDMLPANPDFYNIFQFNTPAVFRVKPNQKDSTACNTLFNPDTGTSYADYVNNKFNFCGSMDGGIVLLTPSKKLYKQYKKFTHDIYKNGIYSRRETFPDEMSLFYFLSKQVGNAIYTICRKYSVIPWDFPDEAHGALLYNYNGFYKPWLKGFSLQWDDEKIWHYIYDILPYNETLDKLYNDSIRDHYNNTFLTLEPNMQQKRYNLDNIDLKKLDASNINNKNNNNKKYGILNMTYLKKCLNVDNLTGGLSESDTDKYNNSCIITNIPEIVFLYRGQYYYITSSKNIIQFYIDKYNATNILNLNENHNINVLNNIDLIYATLSYKFNTRNGQMSIIKTINALKYKGHMVLYFSQEKNILYIEQFLKWMNSINDMYYMGAMHYADNKLRCPHPIFIYYKTHKIPSKLYNPKLTITSIIYNNIKLNVVRDDYIIGGTYTRACIALIKNILKNKAITKLIYSDIIHDSFILSVVYCLYLLKRPDIELIVYSNNGIDSMKKTLSYYHSNITFIHESHKTKNSETVYINSAKYKKILHKKLLKHLEKIKNKIKRLWLIIDSDTILYTLQKCLPYTHFLGIHVDSNHTDYAVYDSQRLKQYDGAVVDIISKYAENDDHIWYIDGNHKILL